MVAKLCDYVCLVSKSAVHVAFAMHDQTYVSCFAGASISVDRVWVGQVQFGVVISNYFF